MDPWTALLALESGLVTFCLAWGEDGLEANTDLTEADVDDLELQDQAARSLPNSYWQGLVP